MEEVQMSKIAIVNQTDQQTKYIEELERTGHHLSLLDGDAISDQLQQMNAVILFSNHPKDVEQIYEWVINIRKSAFNNYIFILAKEIKKVHHVVLLQLGCDCLFTESMGTDIFSLSISNFLKRQRSTELTNLEKKEEIFEKNIELVPHKFSVILEGNREVHLTKLEFKALDYLTGKRGKTASYQELYQHMWNRQDTCKIYRVSNVIFHLREKIEKDMGNPEYIENVRAQGYLLKNSKKRQK